VTELQFHLTQVMHCGTYAGMINENMRLLLQHYEAVPLCSIPVTILQPFASRPVCAICWVSSGFNILIRITSKPSFLLDRPFVNQGPTNLPDMPQIRLYSRR